MPLRGVNLGGWLVLERWMTPALFKDTEARDEYTFSQTPGAEQKLRQHRENFIVEEDFRWLAEHGLNAVRLPVGYWVFGDAAPYYGCIDRLDWAMQMAEKYGLKVLLCLHGAPGSQNGLDHSGQIGSADWYSHPEYQQQTVDVLVRLAERYRANEYFWGLELLNEPRIKLWQPTLRAFYRAANKAVSAVARPGLVIVFSDAFTPRLLSGALKARADHPVMLDHHWYHFFIPGWLQPYVPFSIYYLYLQLKGDLLSRLSRQQPVIVGEWNGIIGGEKLNKYPRSEHPAIVKSHIIHQLKAYQNLAGWFYWNYKTESRGIFHFRSLMEDDVITRDMLK